MKIKKIITATMMSVASLSAVACGTSNSKLAKKINNGMDDFVSSINKLDYVDTEKTNNSIGKIVSASANFDSMYIAPTASNLEIENTITRPSEHNDNFKLYVLSDIPFVTLTSDDNSTNLNMTIKFSTEKIETTSNEISEKINKLILKRSILMIYVNEIFNGNVTLTEENRTAINAYVNVIKENASFLNGNRGMVKNQLNMASDLLNNDSSDNLINYYIIKSGEALEIRANKIDSAISAIDSIIDIIENNLTSNSNYYQTNLSDTYNNVISNLKNTTSTNNNIELARNIADSLNFATIENNDQNNNTNTNNVIQNNNTLTENKTNNLLQNQNSINQNNIQKTQNLTNNIENSNITQQNSLNNVKQNSITTPTNNQQNSQLQSNTQQNLTNKTLNSTKENTLQNSTSNTTNNQNINTSNTQQNLNNYTQNENRIKRRNTYIDQQRNTYTQNNLNETNRNNTTNRINNSVNKQTTNEFNNEDDNVVTRVPHRAHRQSYMQ